MDARIETLAKNLVNYSCKVKEGEKVYINYIGKETENRRRKKGKREETSRNRQDWKQTCWKDKRTRKKRARVWKGNKGS